MTILDRLRQLYDSLPEGASVVLTRDDLRELLADDAVEDLTCEAIGRQLGRSSACIRGWCSSGKIAGAYRLNGKEWRVPPASLRAFLDEQARTHGSAEPKSTAPADLGAWRRVRRGAA